MTIAEKTRTLAPMKKSKRSNIVLVSTAVLVAALLIKFLWPLFEFDLPLGYDVGFYRYLFFKHAEAFPPFTMADLPGWAKGHPLGLFFFSTILLKLGVPVDWLIGWIWNVFAVALPCIFARVIQKRYGKHAGVLTLFTFLLSVAYFDGFAAMYWKTFASLLWCVLAFYALEKKSWLAIPAGILAVATHHQTGLLFGLAFVTWAVLPLVPFSKSTSTTLIGKKMKLRDVLVAAGIGVLILAIGLLAYLPVWKESVLVHLPALFGQGEVASGSFPAASFYLRLQPLLLVLGAYGLFLDIKRERWTPWQIAVLWSLLFVVARLLFYRRFFLQLDFFLLPFAAIGLEAAWHKAKTYRAHSVLAVVVLVQLAVSISAMNLRTPITDDETFAQVRETRHILPANAFIVGLENESVVVMQGWMPERKIGGPGLFETPWTMQDWEKYLLGTHADRAAISARLPDPAYLFVSNYFLSYYGEYAQAFLNDSCFEKTAQPFLYRVACATPQQ